MENQQGTQVHAQSLKVPTGAAPHHESKRKHRNAPLEVASGAVWNLLCLCRLIIIFGGKKFKNLYFLQVVGKSEILIRKKKGRYFNMGI